MNIKKVLLCNVNLLGWRRIRSLLSWHWFVCCYCCFSYGFWVGCGEFSESVMIWESCEWMSFKQLKTSRFTLYHYHNCTTRLQNVFLKGVFWNYKEQFKKTENDRVKGHRSVSQSVRSSQVGGWYLDDNILTVIVTLLDVICLWWL